MEKTSPANPDLQEKPWHSMGLPDVLTSLRSDSLKGLDDAEVRNRMAAQGENVLTEAKPINPWRIFANQFLSPLVGLLILAGAVAGLLGEVIDSLAILGIVILNGVIGFFQEYKAEKSIAALRGMTAPKARIIRQGETKEINAKDIVTGDILVIESGDVVAADARLLESFSLRMVESALTGESQPTDKQAVAILTEDVALGDRTNCVFMGTHVVNGKARAVITHTGMQTEIGKIAALLNSAGGEESTPLQIKLRDFGKVMAWSCLALVAFVFVLGMLRGIPPIDLFLTSVSLAVAAVPEGLPAVVTIALALGVTRMAKRHALIRKLPSVETLGSAQVICTDKTGTLTLGEMTVREVFVGAQRYEISGNGLQPEGELKPGLEATNPTQQKALMSLAEIQLGNNQSTVVQEKGIWKAIGDPTEAALKVAAGKLGIESNYLNQWKVELEFPFDSDRKCSSVLRIHGDGAKRLLVHGAPDILLDHCTRWLGPEGEQSLEAAHRATILQANQTMAESGLRVIGSAFRDGTELALGESTFENWEKDLVFTGLSGMADPPRPEIPEAIQKCFQAGITVIMITGDHPATALAIAKEIGITKLNDAVVTGKEIDSFSESQLKSRLDSARVFARVTPEHKLRLVRALQSLDKIVAMTGDGVNDAPALKGADIGIAMGKAGTEVTKQAADMVLADDNFASIVAAIEEGRGTYANIRRTLQYLLAGNAGELMMMITALALGMPVPLLPIHLLWVNLITDGPPALVLAAQPTDPDLMKRAPRSREDSLTGGRFLWNMMITGLLTGGTSFLAFYIGWKEAGLATGRALGFSTLVFSEVLRALAYHRSETPIWAGSLRGMGRLGVTVFGLLAFQISVHYIPFFREILKIEPLQIKGYLILIGLGSIPLFVLETAKMKVFKRKH